MRNWLKQQLVMGTVGGIPLGLLGYSMYNLQTLPEFVISITAGFLYAAFVITPVIQAFDKLNNPGECC